MNEKIIPGLVPSNIETELEDLKIFSKLLSSPVVDTESFFLVQRQKETTEKSRKEEGSRQWKPEVTGYNAGSLDRCSPARSAQCTPLEKCLSLPQREPSVCSAHRVWETGN